MDLKSAARPSTVSEQTEIWVESLCKNFGDNTVLRGVDLEIRRGELIAIVGGSGCGKTVLLNHILGLLQGDSGRVLVRDHAQPDTPIVDLSTFEDQLELDRIHTHWGVVFQRNALFSGTVLDNIGLFLCEVKNYEIEDVKPIAKSVLSAVGLPSDEEFLNLDVDSLSGGMAKRLAVSRALSMNPAVIFYDEPTTGLDPTSANQIHELISSTHLNQTRSQTNTTTIIITHDKDLLIRLSPRIIMLHEGRVLFDGSFEQFGHSKSPVIRPYFELMPILHNPA
ncbi:MAG: ATP-binding cassette domain-containing protein [Rhodospirillaceae bacterium]|jgi:phospholipid/cholesterol/gamma-HCH transport system ATP-binding protein|nr:ATP-binding cassette domain-containing protein [Rhodospirillaceae bacterium]MBT4588104.1 ATP-binding cassette domain-containing protein [Rhodospirillaceae bacterium]MBT4939978.1 ATP-binding cassette domain-containing protein [Rhodospirillaceae bacterium]MBT5941370.1 ATP-binding cassette domain-containing protein [Rhodospirillaceae bacterium]MBT7268432.1 ATP-binding cassette domain-containing protein [Rhodospirillaceae bacterium]